MQTTSGSRVSSAERMLAHAVSAEGEDRFASALIDMFPLRAREIGQTAASPIRNQLLDLVALSMSTEKAVSGASAARTRRYDARH